MNGSLASETAPNARLLLKPGDAAHALQISPRTLWSLTKRRMIPCVKRGRIVRYDPRDLSSFIDAQKRT